ncbi:aldo/keto reductase [Brevibacillus dissolubilis]|uniref:aldo/keto reductase n=1 Tax=Brevibacillus dissolubilis TaxID=1844116 RepID=UPI001116428B|nr:aldo/keto reductase [Brevibacillus dissolubilis]
MTEKRLPQVTLGPDRVPVSAIGLGCMGLSGTWNPAEVGPQNIEAAFTALNTALGAGITMFDHADIYGNRSCEDIFGQFLAANAGLREKIFIATKCGILFEDEHGPQRYNLTYDYITTSLEGSLHRLQTTYIDLYQIHRPDPLTHPRETARALNQIVADGRVRMIGVSNYFPSQVSALQAYLDVPIVTTQPSISLWNMEALHNGVLDQATQFDIRPLAYSPLGGGLLTGKADPSKLEGQDAHRYGTLTACFAELGAKYDATPSQLSLAWLMHHPAQIIPLLGSNRPENIREGAEACRIQLSREDWYKLWVAGRGERLP